MESEDAAGVGSGARVSVALGDVDLRAVRVRIDTEDGEPVVAVDDGQCSVMLHPGVNGKYEQAILGAQRFADVLAEYVGVLRARSGAGSG